MVQTQNKGCRVAHLTSVHQPFDVRIFHKQCRTLVDAGYDVILIAPHDAGEVTEKGVRLRTVPLPQERRERLMRTVWHVYKAAVAADADIYHFHDPELMPVGVLLKLHGKQVIYDVHEDHTANAVSKHWIPALLRWPTSFAIQICELASCAFYDRVIAVTPAIAAKYGASKTFLVQNYPWRDELRCTSTMRYEDRESLAVYVGVLHEGRGVHEMVEAVALAAQKAKLRLVLAGPMDDSVRSDVERGRATGLVEYHEWLSRPQAREMLGQVRMGLVLFSPAKNHIRAQPNKLFEYMSAGLPVLASDFPLWREIVATANCGLLVDPSNPKAIAEAIIWLLEHPAEAAEMGRNGQRAVLEKYNWESESQHLLSIYEGLRAPDSNWRSSLTRNNA